MVGDAARARRAAPGSTQRCQPCAARHRSGSARARCVRALDAAAGEERVEGERRPSGLPPSDVLAFQSEDGARLIVRPSGTEPKIKFYLELVGRADSREAVAPARARLDAEARTLAGRPHEGAPPRMRRAALALLVLGVAGSSHAQERGAPPLVDNVLVVTFDGMRWQELFGGLDRSLNTKPEGGVAKPEIVAARFDAGDARGSAARRCCPSSGPSWRARASSSATRRAGAPVRVTNGLWFSYPGYNEMLTGVADPRVDSNDKKVNPNLTVLEWLNGTARLRGPGRRVRQLGRAAVHRRRRAHGPAT